MTSRIPDAADPFEEEGLPGMNDGLASKRITGDTQDGIPAPHDSSVAVEDFGTTGLEEREGEPHNVRLAREQPDAGSQAGEQADRSEQSDMPYPTDPELKAGRIVQPDEGARPDTEEDEAGRSVGTDSGGFSAEERAIHVEPEA